MKLYYSPGACSLAVHIALREARLPVDLCKVDLRTRRTEHGEDYRALNPRGYVPLLELDDGTRHTEAAALLQHIGDLAPASGLLPAAGSAARLKATGWLNYIATEMHKPFGWLWTPGTAESVLQACIAKLRAALGELERTLARQPYLSGTEFGVADAYCFTVLGWAPMVGLDLADHPQVQSYLGRVAQRPAVRQSLAAEGLAPA